MGLPENNLLGDWAGILDGFGIQDAERITAVLDSARAAADRAGEWRNWSFLTLQIQLAAERMHMRNPHPITSSPELQVELPEDPNCEWAQAKEKIRTLVGEIPFANWFEASRQIGVDGTTVTIAVPDEWTREYLESEYRNIIETATSAVGIGGVRVTIDTPS
jgi:hypothetical protein